MLNFVFNLIYPWFMMQTNPQLNGSDPNCVDNWGCLIYYVVILVHWFAHLIIYGVPLLAMLVY